MAPQRDRIVVGPVSGDPHLQVVRAPRPPLLGRPARPAVVGGDRHGVQRVAGDGATTAVRSAAVGAASTRGGAP